jgi:hypothetical protein
MWLKVTVAVFGVTSVQDISAISAFIVSLGFVFTDYLARTDSFSAVRSSIGPAAGLQAGVGPGLAAGLAFGLAIGLVSARWRLPDPSRGVRWQFSPASLAAGLCSGLAVGLGTGLTYGLSSGPAAGLGYGLAAGLAVGVAVGLAVGLGIPHDLTVAASPRAVLGRDRRAALVIGLGAGLGVGIAAGLGFPPATGGLVGIAAGFGFAMIVSMLKDRVALLRHDQGLAGAAPSAAVHHSSPCVKTLIADDHRFRASLMSSRRS